MICEPFPVDKLQVPHHVTIKITAASICSTVSEDDHNIQDMEENSTQPCTGNVFLSISCVCFVHVSGWCCRTYLQ